jgi:hypothetical protein
METFCLGNILCVRRLYFVFESQFLATKFVSDMYKCKVLVTKFG